MGLFKRSQTSAAISTSTSSTQQDDQETKRKRKKSLFNLVIPKNRVTEATLQVWRALPGEIRQDPSMINFQREAERWQGIFFSLLF
jgi:hypothetical protein